MSVTIDSVAHSVKQSRIVLIQKFSDIYRKIWKRLEPLIENPKKLYDEIEFLKKEIAGDKDAIFVLNKLLNYKKLFPILDKVNRHDISGGPKQSESFEIEHKEYGDDVRVILHKTPIIFFDGKTPIKTSVEIIINLDQDSFFKKLTEEYGTELSNLGFHCFICQILRDFIKITQQTKKIIRSSQDIKICIHYLHPANTLSKRTFMPVDWLAMVTSRFNLEIANFLLKNYRFSVNEYLLSMRAAIRNDNVKLLSTILKNQVPDMTWEEYFPFIIQTQGGSEDLTLSHFFTNQNRNLKEYLLQHPASISDSPLSYALRKGSNSKIIQILLEHGAHPVLECRDHKIDVSKELAEFQATQRGQKTAFLMAFKARLGQNSAAFHQLAQSDIAHTKPLTRSIFEYL